MINKPGWKRHEAHVCCPMWSQRGLAMDSKMPPSCHWTSIPKNLPLMSIHCNSTSIMYYIFKPMSFLVQFSTTWIIHNQ